MKFRNQILSIIVASLVLVLILSVAFARTIFSRTIIESEKISLSNQCNYIESSGLINDTAGLDEYALDHNVRITIIDKDGNPIYDSYVNYMLMDNHLYRSEIVSARDDGDGNSIRESASTHHRTMYSAKFFPESNLYVRVASNIEELNVWGSQFISSLLPVLSLITLLIVILVIVFNHYLSKPVRILTEAADRYGKGDFTQKTDIRNPEEFALLSHTMNNMAMHIDSQIKALTEDRRTYSLMLTSMIEGVICTDANKRVTLCNSAAIKMFGMEVAINSNLMEILGDRKLDIEVEKVIKTGKAVNYSMIRFGNYNGDTASILGEGKQRYYKVVIAPIVEEKGVSGIIMTINDVTEVLHLEEVRKDFVANVSHELKTPLTSINGFSELLMNPDLSKEEIKKFANIISKNSQNMKQIVQDLLILASLEKEGTNIPMKLENVRLIIKEAVETATFKAEEKDMSIKVSYLSSNGENLSEKEDIELYCSGNLLRQAISNLILNAIAYSGSSTKVWVRIASLKDDISIAVEDKGIGISRIHQTRIFERFYRVDKDRSRSSGGTGLGLSIVRHITDLHQGTLSLESEVGQGSTFTILIPKQQQDLSLLKEKSHNLYPYMD